MTGGEERGLPQDAGGCGRPGDGRRVEDARAAVSSPGAAPPGAGGRTVGRRRFLRLAAYAAPAAMALDLALAARAAAASPPPMAFEWPDDEEYGGPFPVP